MRLGRSALTLAIGYALTAALFWALLNVPESSLLALAASLLLVLLTVAAAGLATAAAAAVLFGASGTAVARRALTAMPAFLLGITLFAALWWMTTATDGAWARSRGEIDAVLLRYLGATRSGPLHAAERAITWILRWGLGLSIVAALVSAGALGGVHAIGRGLRAAVGLVPLAAVTLGAVAVGEGLWRIAAWRPRGLPPSAVELVFVGAKLAVLYLLFVLIAAAVLEVHRRAVQRALNPR